MFKPPNPKVLRAKSSRFAAACKSVAAQHFEMQTDWNITSVLVVALLNPAPLLFTNDLKGNFGLKANESKKRTVLKS
jgi:hypothetical protein